MAPLGATLLPLLLVSSADAFSLTASAHAARLAAPGRAPPSSMRISVTRPSQAEKASLGLQGNTDNIWLPTTVTAGAPLTERLEQDVSRYVSEGKGRVSAGSDNLRISPGSLVTVVDGPADLTWTSEEDMVLLISEYWSPARVAARAALPAVLPVLGVLAAAALAYSAVTS